ncbi:MAG: ABC transporter permease [Thaumarchaeota archaeon]|nr:ABC transporter permease [Nitrososphaerota archaeon]
MNPGPSVETARISTIAQVRIVTKYAFLNYFRSRRFYVMLTIVLLMSGLLTFAAGYYRPAFFGFGVPTTGNPSLPFYTAWWGNFVLLVTLLSVAFFGGDAISGEFQNKTGYFLVPNPIRRSAVYAGKWFAALIAATTMLAIFALIALGNGVYFFGTSVPYEFAESVLFAWFDLVAVLAFAFMFSSLFKSSAISVLMIVIMLLFVFNIVDTILTAVAGIEPWFSIVYAGSIIPSVLTVPYPTTFTAGQGPFRQTVFVPTIPEGLAILAAYFVVTALVGLYLFEKKEFT